MCPWAGPRNLLTGIDHPPSIDGSARAGFYLGGERREHGERLVDAVDSHPVLPDHHQLHRSSEGSHGSPGSRHGLQSPAVT